MSEVGKLSMKMTALRGGGMGFVYSSINPAGMFSLRDDDGVKIHI